MKLTNQTIKKIHGTHNSSERHKLLTGVNSDAFDKDVLDGITNSELLSSDFEELDRKFYRSKPFLSSSLSLIIGLVLITGISVFLLYQSKNTEQENSKNTVANGISKTENSNQKIKTNKKSKTEIHKKIEFDKSIKNNDNNVKIESKNNQSQTNTNNSKNINNDLFEIKPLPLNKNILTENKLQNSVGKQGAEVFIFKYKTLDYRQYRKKPEKKLDPLNLTNGTPANSVNKKENMIDNQEIEYNYFNYLKETMKFFDKKMYPMALSNFNTIMETYPDDVNALFYGGICHFEQKNFNESIVFFDLVRKSLFLNFKEESEWFLLQSYIETNNSEKAKSLRNEIINNNGFYAKRAKELKID